MIESLTPPFPAIPPPPRTKERKPRVNKRRERTAEEGEEGGKESPGLKRCRARDLPRIPSRCWGVVGSSIAYVCCCAELDVFYFSLGLDTTREAARC